MEYSICLLGDIVCLLLPILQGFERHSEVAGIGSEVSVKCQWGEVKETACLERKISQCLSTGELLDTVDGFISQHSSNCHYILLSISEYHGSPNFIAFNSIQGAFSIK